MFVLYALVNGVAGQSIACLPSMLYSIGEDGQYDGGNFMNMMMLMGGGQRNYDLDLDTMIRP